MGRKVSQMGFHGTGISAPEQTGELRPGNGIVLP
jgi:hypothetical protein